jgi:hypothetical protein
MHYPSVTRLDIHLPNEQMVTFTADLTPQQLREARELTQRGTKLMAFFTLCDHDLDARNYKYSEIPTHYTWHPNPRQWQRRTNPPIQNVVTRIYTASIADMELYSLRLLLLSVPGPTSFEDIRTYDGIVHETFQAAANARGLLESDNEWDRCLEEAGMTAPFPKMIRQLFCYILVNCSPADPLALWTTHRDRMSDDYFFELRRNLQISNNESLDDNQKDQIYKRTLGDIELHLQTIGYRLSRFPTLPQEIITQLDSLPFVESLAISETRDYNIDEQAIFLNNNVPLLNTEQQQAYDRILAAIDSTDTPYTPKLFFVNGAGGTGKSLLFKIVLSYVRSQSKLALPVATSGIAAILLPGGRTAHSRFKIPMNADDDTTSSMRLGGPHAHLIATASVIIWDEAVMCHKNVFQVVDRLLRDIMGAVDIDLEDVPFGGKVVIFGGDFRQILPVVPRGTPAEIIAACIRSTSFWPHVEVLPLKRNMRVQPPTSSETPQWVSGFAQFIINIGDGRPPYDQQVELPDQCVMDSNNIPLFLNAVYPFLGLNSPVNPHEYRTKAILATKNDDVDSINGIAFNLFPGIQQTYS